MALRKQRIQDISSESQQDDEDTQEDKGATGIDSEDENSSLLLTKSFTNDRRWRERDRRSKSKEMTEEEMMDMALRLSEQEASATALQQQQEEADVMKAIQESMVSQRQPRQTSTGQTTFPDGSRRLASRRKLSYSNGDVLSVVCQDAMEDGCISEADVKSAKGIGDINVNRNKKLKKRAGSPLLEMPDLSQTQKVSSQASPCSSEYLSAALDSPQSSDSTQIDNFQLQKSPIFPLTGGRAAVQIDRLSQNLVETCRNSGFVLCSQNSWTLTEKSAQPKGPTLTQSNLTTCPKSPVFAEGEWGVDGQMELSSEYAKSPVFGRNIHRERAPSACKYHVSVYSPTCENPEVVFSSQENLTSSIKCEFCPRSPVFPKSPSSPKIPSPSHQSVLPKSPYQGDSDLSQDCSKSPVFCLEEAEQITHIDTQKKSTGPPAPERQDSNDEQSPSCSREVSGWQVDNGNMIAQLQKSEELNDKSKDLDRAEAELTSNMTLVWSDEDEEDVTVPSYSPVGSPSPVFPEESPPHRQESQTDTVTHCPATSMGPNSRHQQLSSTESETQLGDRHKLISRVTQPLRESLGQQTVHYYWGVPFCPRGLDPDSYTKVIEAQMEAYEKSLKAAQRCLLRKAKWGEAILPQPEKCPSPEVLPESTQHHVPRRRGLRLRSDKRGEITDTTSVEEEEKEEDEQHNNDGNNKEDQQQKEEEEEKNGEDEEQMETDDCEVCPETQLSDNDSTQDLTMVTDAEPSPKSLELPEIEIKLRSKCPAGAETKDEAEDGAHMDGSGDEKIEENILGCCQDARGQNTEEVEGKKDRTDPYAEEFKDRGFQKSPSPEVEPAVVPRSVGASIKCPICQVPFPVNEIEVHAAFCDGDVAVVGERRTDGDRFQESPKHRRKRTRKAERTVEATKDFNVSRNQEKCFVCQKTVPLSEYKRHTDICIQHQSRTAAKGNLLSALEQTESRNLDARPSGSKLPPEDVIDLRDDDDDDEEHSAPAFSVSNSPIRSFTPISEATNCLIDFKKQHRSKRPTQRRR